MSTNFVAKQSKQLLADDDAFVVPDIIDQASGREVLTMQRMSGIGVTKLAAEATSQEDKDWIGEQIMRLCLREIMEFQFRQTDLNWTNFLYDNTSQPRQLQLLDFGASRSYPAAFMNTYIALLEAA